MTNYRNIIVTTSGAIVVKVFRNRQCYYARAATIPKAIKIRDQIERDHKPEKQWGYVGKRLKTRTCRVIREERKRNGECIYCGVQNDRLNRVSCSECANVKKIKRQVAA